LASASARRFNLAVSAADFVRRPIAQLSAKHDALFIGWRASRKSPAIERLEHGRLQVIADQWTRARLDPYSRTAAQCSGDPRQHLEAG
jgi:hypothetical protein